MLLCILRVSIRLLMLMLMLKVRCFDVTNQYSHRFHDDILCILFFPLIAILVDFQNAHSFLLWNCTTGFTDFVLKYIIN